MNTHGQALANAALTRSLPLRNVLALSFFSALYSPAYQRRPPLRP
jgi:hypothetical protein